MNRIWKRMKAALSARLIRFVAKVMSKRGTGFRLVKEAIVRDDILRFLAEDQRILERLSRNRAVFDKVAGDENFLNKLAQRENAFHFLAKHGWIQRAVDFEKNWQKVRQKMALSLQEDSKPNTVFAQLSLHAANRQNLREAILATVGDENLFNYGEMRVRHSDKNSLWILINEILVNEDYYFDSNTSSPKILDCGCHFGLATLYLKQIYPNAKVTAFEPVPEIFAVAKQNFESCGLKDVTLLPYALSNEEQTATLHVSNNNPMGSSLENRYEGTDDTITPIEVQCKKLSSYLQQPVDLLKLDIEGAEHLVLEEARPFLGNVHYLFVEVHILDGQTTRRLGSIITLLESAGFQLHCSKSWTSQSRTCFRPFDYVHEPLTHVIWAKNTNYPRNSQEQL